MIDKGTDKTQSDVRHHLGWYAVAFHQLPPGQIVPSIAGLRRLFGSGTAGAVPNDVLGSVLSEERYQTSNKKVEQRFLHASCHATGGSVGHPRLPRPESLPLDVSRRRFA